MRRPSVAVIALACVSLLGLMLVTMLASSAQTWTWTYAAQTPNNPLVIARSTVAVSANAVRTTYMVPLQHRNIVIESCSADLRDIQDATTMRTQGTAFLLIRFKPSRGANCASGKRLAVALPGDDHRYIDDVAAEINRSCCSTARIAADAAPTPSPTQTPAPAPSAAPSPSAAPLQLQDWVESEGLFSFVRIRNASPARVAIAGTTFDCRNSDSGCGSFTGNSQIEAGSVATVATITSLDEAQIPAFHYRYTASGAGQTISAVGSSAKSAPPSIARMSAPELRAAQAAAIGGLRPVAAAEVPTPGVAPRLLRRGSSRLAIGQMGTALVRLTIAPNGMPQEATIISVTNRQLSAAAIETAVSSTYAPAMLNGRAVTAKYVATFSFDGEDPALSGIPVWKRSPLPSTGVPAPAPSPATDPSPAASESPAPGVPAPTISPAPSLTAVPDGQPATEPQTAPGVTPAAATSPAANPTPSPTDMPSPNLTPPPYTMPSPNLTPAPNSTGSPAPR